MNPFRNMIRTVKEIIGTILKKIGLFELAVMTLPVITRRLSEFRSIKYKLIDLKEEQIIDRDIIFKPDCVSVRLPKVQDLVEAGEVQMSHQGCELITMEYVTVFPHSDVILTSKGAILKKAFIPQINYETLLNRNVVKMQKEKAAIFLKKPRKIHRISLAYSALGVHDSHWGHFILEFLPKLAIAENKLKSIKPTILLPASLDAHMRSIVDYILGSYYEKIYVESNDAVEVEKLYFCTACSYVANHADYLHLTAIVIPEWTRKEIFHCVDIISKSVPSDSSFDDLRLFVTRRKGSRVSKNVIDIEQFFEKHNFRIIEPHALSLDQKINLFRNATHIAGFFGSGMANLIFRQSSLKVLAIGNYERSLETFLSQLVKPGQSVNYFIGDQDGPRGIHSNFTVSLNRLSRFIDEINYL